MTLESIFFSDAGAIVEIAGRVLRLFTKHPTPEISEFVGTIVTHEIKNNNAAEDEQVIELITGYLKTDFRVTRNFLKAITDDRTYRLMLALCLEYSKTDKAVTKPVDTTIALLSVFNVSAWA